MLRLLVPSLLLLLSLAQSSLAVTYVEFGPDYDSLGWEYHPGTYDYAFAATLKECQDQVTALGWTGYIYRYPRDCYRFKE